MERYWFKAKEYGWGVYPASWQGWVATSVLLVIIFLCAYADGVFVEDPEARSLLRFFIDMILLSTMFCLVMSDKTEGGVKWRWGK